eukprot:363960-Chlamydomonas_euryale.AAC.1
MPTRLHAHQLPPRCTPPPTCHVNVPHPVPPPHTPSPAKWTCHKQTSPSVHTLPPAKPTYHAPDSPHTHAHTHTHTHTRAHTPTRKFDRSSPRPPTLTAALSPMSSAWNPAALSSGRRSVAAS